MKKVIVTIFAIFITITGVLFSILPSREDLTAYEVLTIKNGNKHLYIKRKVWGFAADHQVVAISNSSKKSFQVDKKKDYVYYNSGPMFYKQVKDTVFFYAGASSAVPVNFEKSIVVEQILWDNQKMMTLLENDNYKNEGLLLVSR